MGQLTILPSRNLEKTGVEASSGARRQERGEVGQVWEKQEEMSDMKKETIEKMRFCGGQWLWSRSEKGEGQYWHGLWGNANTCTSQVMESTPSKGGLSRVHLQCRNLQEFLGSLSPGVLDRLYGHPATCLAVFR